MTGNMALRRMRLGALAQAGASSAGAGKAELAVSEVKAYALREPVSRRGYTVVEVRTKGGLTGYGECPSAAVLNRSSTRLFARWIGRRGQWLRKALSS